MFVKVARSALHGNGCFTTRDVPAGGVVAESRILVFSPEEMEPLFRTSLKNYLFYLKDGDPHDPHFYTALAVGPISFCNHSAEPNCDFALDEGSGEIRLTARRDLTRNEEITIDYGDYAAEII